MMSSLREKKSGYKPDGTLPLINIVLMLVLAFMMAGTFEEPLPADFSPVRSGQAEASDQKEMPVILTMNLEGTVSLEGRDQSTGELDAILQRLEQSEHSLEVRADARTPAVRVIALLGSVERAGITDVQIVTLGRQ